MRSRRSQVLDYLAGNGPLTRYRENKYGALAGFYRYAISRGYASFLAAARQRAEAAQIAAALHLLPRRALPSVQRRRDDASPTRFSWTGRPCDTLLLLLYGAALRGGEARSLTIDDVDLSEAVLTVRDAKFYKSRLVPVGPQLADRLRRYAEIRADRPCSAGAGIHVPGEHGRNAAAQGHGLLRLPEAAEPRRDRVHRRLAAGAATALAPAQLRGASS